MAKSWTNTVPDGRIGTGNAQVYNNPLPDQFAGQLQNMRQRQELEAQKLAKAWRDNQLAASQGYLWAKDMSDIEKGVIDEGIKLQQQGLDPYGNSPEALDFLKRKRYVESQQGYRKGVEAQITDAFTKIRANPDKYDPRSVQALNDWIGKTKLSDAFDRNELPPQLEELFNDADFLKNYKAVTRENDVVRNGVRVADTTLDAPQTKKVVLSAYLSDPRGKKRILEVTEGLNPMDVERDFAPNYSENIKNVTDYIKGNKSERERLAAQGILPDTPQMEEYVSDLAAKQTGIRKKYDNFMRGAVDQLSSGAKLSHQETPFKDPNEMTEYQRRSLDLRERAENRQAAEGAGSNENAGIPRDINLSYNDGKANVNVKDYVGMSVPAKSLVGLPTYNLKTGSKSDKLEPSVDAKIVGVGNFPIITKGKTLKGTIAQPNFAKENPDAVQDEAMIHIKVPVVGQSNMYRDKLIPYSALPENVKNSKAIREALANFKPATNSPAPATYKKGYVENGYEYIGGDPANQKSWRKK